VTYSAGERDHDSRLGPWSLRLLETPAALGAADIEMFRLSWKWRERSSVKIAERTYEKRTEALHCRGGAHRVKKKSWGTLTATWVPHDVRDQVVDFVRRWSEKSEIGVGRFIAWLGVTTSKAGLIRVRRGIWKGMARRQRRREESERCL
jgi:hypothetical protein